MAFPTGWPPRYPSSVRSLRFYKTGTLTGNFSDNAWLFSGGGSATFVPLPVVVPGSIAPVHIGQIEDATAHPPVPAAPSTPLGGGQNDLGAPIPMVWSDTLALYVSGGDLYFSFDGETVHGQVPSGERFVYRHRYEAGIAVRGTVSATYIVEAW